MAPKNLASATAGGRTPLARDNIEKSTFCWSTKCEVEILLINNFFIFFCWSTFWWFSILKILLINKILIYFFVDQQFFFSFLLINILGNLGNDWCIYLLSVGCWKSFNIFLTFLCGHVSFFAAPLRSEACFRMIAGLHGTGFSLQFDGANILLWNDCGTHSFSTCPWVRWHKWTQLRECRASATEPCEKLCRVFTR